MNLNDGDGDGVSFCKILLSDSVDYLPLPADFAKKYLQKGNNKKQTLVLNSKSGVKWSVKYLQIEDRYYFMDGWLKFMKDNHVQKGDILVFWLLSPPKSVFQVFLYAPNGCLKYPTTCSGVSGVKGNKRLKKALIIKEDSSDVDSSDDDSSDDGSSGDDSRENVQQSLTKILRKSYIHAMTGINLWQPMNKSFVNASGINGYSSLRLRNDEGEIWEVKVRKHRKQKTPYMTTGWLDFCDDNNIQIGDTCEFNHVKANLLHVHVFKKKGRPFNKNRSN